ncbi:MAG TPA: UbiX family flavin prenyltransferase [Dissulfurispiraceae bacterium]|nr:UbiX family flavin prenyltransferase [Dissulfurispiraceae bacterium]
MKRYVLAITGASGSILGVRLLEELVKRSEVHLLVSRNTFPIILDETGLDWSADTEALLRDTYRADRIFFHEDTNMYAPVSSGSYKTDGMFIVPCTMKTLAGIACGYANNLIERAADVTIKEGRPLLLAPREMPFSSVHLENMLKLSRIGVRIAPPVPAFYQGPKTLNDMVDFMIGKMLDAMAIEHGLFRRWGSGPS